MPEQITPCGRVVTTMLGGRAALVELPVSPTHAIIEAKRLPSELDFPPSFPRVYLVMDLDKSGSHAHKPGTESELMLVAAGEATVYLWDEEGNREKITLSRSYSVELGKHLAVFIKAGIWHTVRYRPGTVLLVAASCGYDRSYYIEKPEEYFTPVGFERYQRDFT